MCRIAGIIANRLETGEILNKVEIMCEALKHGGPDDQGIFLDESANLVFGNRRLSIIDLSVNGHQPMSDVSQRAWITFNGEIYNYRELKQQLLKSGCKFHSDTDTEVILAAYLYWGVDAFSKLRGMFAFALYDKEKAMVYLVRDTTGIKPLYYHIEDGQLSFASEIRALKLAKIATRTDPTWPVRFLAFGHIPEPFTTLTNVYCLPKGHFLSWNVFNREHKTEPYLNATSSQPVIASVPYAEESIRATLDAAVKRQLISDAPIGVFLSGGVDSSILTLLANRQKEQELRTISIFFNEKAYDEHAFQSQIQKLINGEKFSHLVQQQDFEKFLPDIINKMDMPTTDGINTWFISKYAHHDGLKAVLSGMGADELFGGYPSFNRIRYLAYLRKIPPFIFRGANYFATDRYRKISFLTNRHPLADYLLLRGLFVPQDISQILDLDVRQVDDILFNGIQVPNLGPYDEKHAAWFETNLYMQNQLLHDTDVMSMSHGLEVRVPYLDEDLQKLVQSIDIGIRFNHHQPKQILIDSFKDILPRDVWNRPKMGFTFPLQEWMNQHKEISDPGLYKSKVAQDAVQKFKNGKMHWSKIFALYQIQLHA